MTFFSRKIFRRGFSLIEMMVVVAVLVIISLVAYSYYKNYYLRADLASANARLLHAQLLARTYFVNAHTYVGFCGTYPEFGQPFTRDISFTCSEDIFCFRVRIIGANNLRNLKSLVSETGVRTISIPTGWIMPAQAGRCLVSSESGACV